MSRSPIKVTVDGESLTFREISEKYNVPLSVVHARYFQGYDGEALTKKSLRRVTQPVRAGDIIYPTFGEWVQHQLKKDGLTYKECVLKADGYCNYPQIENWARGERAPRRHILIKVCQKLGWDVYEAEQAIMRDMVYFYEDWEK